MDEKLKALEELTNQRNKLRMDVFNTKAIRDAENEKILLRLQDFQNNLCKLAEFNHTNAVSYSDGVIDMDHYYTFDKLDGGLSIYEKNDDIKNKETDKRILTVNDFYIEAPFSLETIADSEGFVYPEMSWLDTHADKILESVYSHITQAIESQIVNEKIKMEKTLEMQYNPVLNSINMLRKNLSSFMDFCIEEDIFACQQKNELNNMHHIDGKDLGILLSDDKFTLYFNNDINQEQLLLSVDYYGKTGCYFDEIQPERVFYPLYYENPIELNDIINKDGSLKETAAWIYKNINHILDTVYHDLNQVVERCNVEIKYPTMPTEEIEIGGNR